MTPFVAKLTRCVKDFASARDGNVAITFAIALLPILGFAGAAVDYSHAGSARVALQAALDSTALIMSKEAPTLSVNDLKTRTDAVFTALFTQKDATVVSIKPTYTKDAGSTLKITGNITVKTDFLSVVGVKALDIGSDSVVKWGNTRMRVALALDVTGSMDSDGKMTALKPAAKSLITQLKNAATVDGDVYVSIIPFAQDVNVGATNFNKTWVDFSEWDKFNGSCSNDYYKTKKDCRDANKTWTPSTHNSSNWNGCVMDRDKQNDVMNTTPVTSSDQTLFPAEQYDACPTPILPLTYNWNTLNSKIDMLDPNGGTNQTIGLAWAWHSLTQGLPLNPPALVANYTYQHVIILMSDGLNTINRWDGNGRDVSTAVDARMNLVCANAKAAGVTIYTIHVNTDRDPTSTVLQNCASDSSKFFVLTSATQMLTTFNQIGTQLSQLRIAE